MQDAMAKPRSANLRGCRARKNVIVFLPIIYMRGAPPVPAARPMPFSNCPDCTQARCALNRYEAGRHRTIKQQLEQIVEQARQQLKGQTQQQQLKLTNIETYYHANMKTTQHTNTKSNKQPYNESKHAS